jgi:chromosome segregation ATPase
MRADFKYLLGVSLLAPLLIVSAAVAQGNNPNRSSRQQAQTDTVQTSQEDGGETRERRLEKLKERLERRPTFARQMRIKDRCQTAQQGRIRSLSGRIQGLETSRNQVYSNLLNRLNSLSNKLQDKGLDTTELNVQIAELQTRIETFQDDLTEYKQLVSDLAEVDCQDDPVAFQAALEAAREARKKTAVSAAAIRAYLTDTIKPTMAGLREQLVSDASRQTDDDETNQESGGTE